MKALVSLSLCIALVGCASESERPPQAAPLAGLNVPSATPGRDADRVEPRTDGTPHDGRFRAPDLGVARVERAEDLDVLRLGLFDADAEIREASVDRLGQIGSSDALRLIGLALDDADADVRLVAVDMFEDAGGSIARGYLEQALSSDDEDVRIAARDALDSFPADDA